MGEKETGAILAPIVDNEADDESKPVFAPGVIISGITKPLNKFRDTVLNILPTVQRPFTRQSTDGAAPTTTFVTDCTEYSGIQCSDCNTFVVSNF